ncbi:hypothetical protein ACU4GH_31875 [Bradyrhizobium betae]
MAALNCKRYFDSRLRRRSRRARRAQRDRELNAPPPSARRLLPRRPGRAVLTHVHQPTGAAVPMKPHRNSSAVCYDRGGAEGRQDDGNHGHRERHDDEEA